jgi:4,5-DOPA dioxygenase extradiol
MRQPVLFVSHGAPTLVIDDTPARGFLATLGARIGRPRAILVISAHWETRVPTVSVSAAPETIHDFRGFPPALHAMRHPAPGAPEVAAEVVAARAGAGLAAETAERGLDHGAWVPLTLIDPGAAIAALQLSIVPDAGPAFHRRLGAALAPLRDRGVAIIASGAMTHDLGSFFRSRPGLNDPAPAWVTAFGDWAADRVAANDVEALVDYRARGPHAARNHPTEDHILPLHAALGAAAGEPGRRIHRSHAYAVLQMDVHAWGLAPGAVEDPVEERVDGAA